MLGIALSALAAVFGVFAVRSWRGRGQSVWRGYGFFRSPLAVLDFCVGLIISAIAMAGIYVAERQLGATRLEMLPFDSVALGSMFALLLVSAAAEEFLFRSLLLNGLVTLLHDRRALAIGLSALAFGAIHLANPHGSYIGAFGNALGGVMYGVAFLGARSFWLPLGLHVSWNFVQGPLLGFPVSGQHFAGIAEQHVSGPVLLTGGDYGPEAGLVGMGFRFLVIALVFAYLAVRPKQQSSTE